MNERRAVPTEESTMVALRPRRANGSEPRDLATPVRMTSVNAAPPPTEGMPNWWHVIRRRKWSVLLCVLIFGIAAAVVTKLQTPIYQSRATLEWLPPGDLPSAFRDSSAGPAGSDASLEASMQTYVSLIQHESTVSKVVSRLKLEQRPDFLADPASALWVRMSPSSAEPPTERALKIAERNLGVRAQARIIQLTFDSSDPKLSSDFLNTLTDEFMTENSGKRKEAAQRAADVLYKEAAELRQKLEVTDQRLQAEVRGVGGEAGAGRQNPADDRLRAISAELARAEADRIQKQSQRQVVNSAAPETTAEASGDAPAREYLIRLTDLKRQLAEQSALLTPAHPKVQQIQSQVDVLEKALQTELARVRSRVENDYRGAEERERMLSENYLRQSRAASDVAVKSVTLDRLRHQAEADWNAYAAAFQKARELSLGAITPATDIRVVGSAEMPARPYRPTLWLNLVMALFAGLLVGLAQAVMRERSDVRVHSPGEAAMLLGFPELAAVPQAGRRTGGLLEINPRAKALAAGDDAAPAWQPAPPDMMSDSFRQAAASLCLQHDIRSRVIVVTSPGPGEGKTTVVSNLGATLAQLGSRVLLIDGDLRRPRLHQLFQFPNDAGLLHLLTDSTPEPEPGETYGIEGVRATGVPGLYVMCSGTASSGNGMPDIASLFCSRRMRSLIRRVRHDFDIVLIDAPPALLGADARLLARLSDGVVLVLRSGDTRRDAAQAAVDRLVQDRTSVLGYILNGWDSKTESGYYSDVYRRYQAS